MTTTTAPADQCDGADRPADMYSLDEMVASTGATAKQVDHWTRGGLLHPVARENATSGVPRRWPDTERDVCARMALLVDVGLSLNLAHTVARHRGPYVEHGVTIRFAPDEQTASPIEREVLRYPGRRAVITALHRLLAEAGAAAELIDEYAPVVDGQHRTVPAATLHDIDTLLRVGEIITRGDDYLRKASESAPNVSADPGPDTRTRQ